MTTPAKVLYISYVPFTITFQYKVTDADNTLLYVLQSRSITNTEFVIEDEEEKEVGTFSFPNIFDLHHSLPSLTDLYSIHVPSHEPENLMLVTAFAIAGFIYSKDNKKRR